MEGVWVPPRHFVVLCLVSRCLVSRCVPPLCVARQETSDAENNTEPTETSREKEIVFIGALLCNTFVGGAVIKGGGKQNDPCHACTKHTGV